MRSHLGGEPLGNKCSITPSQTYIFIQFLVPSGTTRRLKNHSLLPPSPSEQVHMP